MTGFLDEPLVRRQPRFAIWYAVVGTLAVPAVLLGIAIYAIREDRAITGCGFTPTGRENHRNDLGLAEQVWAPIYAGARPGSVRR